MLTNPCHTRSGHLTTLTFTAEAKASELFSQREVIVPLLERVLMGGRDELGGKEKS